MDNITKEDLEKKLENIKKRKKEQSDYIVECDKGSEILQRKKSGLLIEITKLNGEERVVNELLALLTKEKAV